jgi:hypothetical protein
MVQSLMRIVHYAFRESFQTYFHIVAWLLGGLLAAHSYRLIRDRARAWHASASIGRRRRRGRSLRSAHGQFVRCAAWQFLWPRRGAGVVHRRRHLGPGASRRAFLRRLRRSSRLDRRILLRVNRHLHLHRHFAIVANVGARAGDRGRSHLHVADDRARRIPEFRIIGRDFQHANVRILGAIPPRLGGR